MKLRFTRRASENIAAIADYLQQRDPAAANRVRTGIDQSLRSLILFPGIGRLQQIAGVRKLVTRHGYLIYDTTNEAEQEVIILAVRHSAQARDFDDM